MYVEINEGMHAFFWCCSSVWSCLEAQINLNFFNECLVCAGDSFKNKAGWLTEVNDIILALKDMKTNNYRVMCCVLSVIIQERAAVELKGGASLSHHRPRKTS